jgi:hypothetical protein
MESPVDVCDSTFSELPETLTAPISGKTIEQPDIKTVVVRGRHSILSPRHRMGSPLQHRNIDGQNSGRIKDFNQCKGNQGPEMTFSVRDIKLS